MTDSDKSLTQLKERWDQAGRSDPFWAVLAHPEKKGNRWAVDEFFQTGVEEIRAVMDEVASKGIALGADHALDFGCGPGRLSQALAAYFKRVDGVDIAASMIELADKYNQHPDQCRFHVNTRDDLAIFGDGTFDFVYSNITLQHMKPVYAQAYIREFIRVLKPGGVLVFQLPSRLLKLQARVKRLVPSSVKARVTKRDDPVRDMNGMPREKVVAYVSGLGAEFVAATPNTDASAGWDSFRYTWRRPL